MAEHNPLRFLLDEFGKPAGLTEYQSGDKLPKGSLPTLDVADVAGLSDALAEKAAADDARLSDAREWTASTVTQDEAEAGTATTRRAWTAQRVRQAIAAWWLGVTSTFGRSLVGATDAAAGRAVLGLGSAATTDASQYATAAQVGDIATALDAINGEVIP